MKKLKLFFAACALLLGVSNASAKTDVTSTYLTNAGLTSLEGWTIDKGFGGNGYTDWKTDGDVPVIEFYHSWSAKAGDPIGTTKTFNFSQVANLPAGYYRLAVNAFYREGNGNGTNTKAYIYAGEQQQYVYGLSAAGVGGYSGANDLYKAANAFSKGDFSNEFDFQVTEAGEVEIGFHGYIDTYCSWCILGPVTLWEYTVEDYYADYDEKYEIAKGLLTKPMNVDVKSALQEAMVDKATLTTVDEAKAAINKLGTAITDAQSSVNAYASANVEAYLTKMKGVLDNTNVYTTDAYNKWYANVQSNFENGLYTDGEVATLTESGAYSTGWHSSNRIDDVLLSTWSIDGVPCGDYSLPLYINTWSVEGNTDGSEFFTPFFEYWTDDAKSLDAKDLVATVSGLKANETYSFTIRARVRQTNNQTKIANGITMKVGSGDAVDISSGNIFKTGPFFIGNFSAVGQTDAEGKLTATISVAENSNISWLSFYNAKYTEGEDLSAYIADYEFALNTAKECKDDAAYAAITGKEKTDLATAISTYSTVDETSKSDLIAAKNALEEATSVFTAAAAAYNILAEMNKTVAAKLGVDLPTVTAETTAADLDVEGIIVAEYAAAKAYATDCTAKLGEWTNAPGTNKGQSWDGTTGDSYYDEYDKADRAMTQEVTLPAGDYALIAKGRASENGLLTVTVDGETVTFAHKGASGRGIATDGAATFADNAIYANNNNGWGWEYRVITFTSDGSTPKTLTFNWKTASSNWCGLDDIVLLGNVFEISEDAAYDNTQEGTGTVTLTRNIKVGYNTLVLPFSMTQDEVEATFGEGSVVYELNSFENEVIGFQTANGISQNTPCILKATEAGTSYDIKGRTIVAGDVNPTATVGAVSLIGSYAASFTVPNNGENYIVSGGKLYLVDSDNVTIAGTRAYFNVVGNQAREISFDGVLTGIATVEKGELKKVFTGDIFDLTGRKVKNPSNGIFVVEGKKVVF